MKDLLGDICGILRDFGGRERESDPKGKEGEREREGAQTAAARESAVGSHFPE